MGIDIKQLTINSNIKSDTAETESNDVDKKSTVQKPFSGESLSCFDADKVKAEILAECKRMIRRATEEQRSR